MSFLWPSSDFVRHPGDVGHFPTGCPHRTFQSFGVSHDQQIWLLDRVFDAKCSYEVSVRIVSSASRPHSGREFQTTPPCMLDDWTKDMIKHHPDLSGEVFQKLILTAMMAHFDMATIEAKHATVRRLLVSRSVQTHKRSFKDLSAEWLCNQARTRKRRPLRVVARKRARKARGLLIAYL